MTDLAEKTATEILTEIDALAERRAQLEELVRELGDALTPVSAFVEDPAGVGSLSHDGSPMDTFDRWRRQDAARVDTDALDGAREGMARVHELMAQIRELLR